MKFRKKPVIIEAVQWFKDGDHPAVQSRAPKIVFDSAGQYYYVARYDDEMLASRGWLAVDPDGDVAQKYGQYLPFAFYKAKSGAEQPISDWPELAARYAAHEGFKSEPTACGYIKTLEGGRIVTPGDWIITGVAGEQYPCKPEIFAETYEAVE